MSNGPFCAHARVEMRTREHKGEGVDLRGEPVTTVSDHWACESCGAAFVPGGDFADWRQVLREGELLHPTGRCGCAGEGQCQWCLLMQAAEERDALRAEVEAMRARRMTEDLAVTSGGEVRELRAEVARLTKEADDLRATQEPLWAQMRSVTRLFGAALEDGAPINAAGASLEAVKIVVGTALRAASKAKAEAYEHAATLCDERRAALGTQHPGAETQLDDLAADLRDLVRRAVVSAGEEE